MAQLRASPLVQRVRRLQRAHPLGRFALPALLIALFLAYPYYYKLPGVSDVTLDLLGLKLDIVFVIAIYVMLALGLNIVVGYAGLLDLGYVAFYALGAYAVGWFASDRFADSVSFHLGSTAPAGLPGIHLNFWLVILVAGVIAGIAGVIIGWPTLRLRGDYLAIVTLGFGEIIPDVFRNADALPVPTGLSGDAPFVDFSKVNFTDGVRGIRLLDRPGFAGWGDSIGLPERFTSVDLKPWFFTIVALCLVVVFVNRRLRESKMGRAWIAVREDEVAASAMGVPLMRTKLWAYGIGAVFGGFAGALYGSFIGSIFPTSFIFNISIIILCMVIVGGMGNIYGVVLGAIVIQYLNLAGMDKIGKGINDGLDLIGTSATVDIPKYKFLIFGLLLVVMMLFRPEGIIPSARRKAEFHEELGEASLYDAAR